jgi:hypothetical protein
MFITSNPLHEFQKGGSILQIAKFYAQNATTEGIEANRVNCWNALRA